MPSKVIAISGPVTRTYTISQNAKLHTVSLFHNTITGQRALSIDGVEVGGTAGTTSLLSPRKALVFQIGEGCGEVSISHEGTHVVYTCFWSVAGPEGASVEVSEENDVVNGTTEADLDGTKDTNRLRISIEAADTGVDETGKPVSWYRIKTLRENDQREVTVHRRFRDFFSVEEQLKSSYKGSHLLASFPSLPPRTLAGSMLSSLFGSTSHLDAGFVEERRWKLSDWLYKTSQLPRMRTNVDFLTFLGICDDFRETSVLFPKDVPMGLTLNKAQGDSVEVGGLKALQDGSPSPAQMSNLIFVGDQVSGKTRQLAISIGRPRTAHRMTSSFLFLLLLLLSIYADLQGQRRQRARRGLRRRHRQGQGRA